ncbi:MAG: CinA family nicotinamide mononucleotide deamidase-related protein [Deltaproteobacteria bacterium]|nr:MAG: CinA family nicotinamide mononucleotide deamidase-related protein [Deltaproteobacteria bacterium]
MPTAAILSQGDEIVTGQTVDTNAAWLGTELTELGFDVIGHWSVRDVRDEITAAVREATERADFVMCTGGLGPTDDDLTAEAVAVAFDMPLVLDEEALAHIRGMYSRYGRVMPEVNAKQALLPTGCARLDNDWGTAPGFAVQANGATLVCVAGVPREMKQLWQHRVLPLIADRFHLEPGRLVTLRTTGVGESNLQERIGRFEHPLAVLAYRTMIPENQIKLRFRPEASEYVVRKVVTEVAEKIGSPLFAIEGLDGHVGGSLIEVIAHHLLQRGETLATAESCTGGRVAATCTSIAGSSDWFLEGAVTYSNAAKARQLGIDPALIENCGAVSTEVAYAMAHGVREVSGSTYGIATTGIAGPGGGSEDKPVGTVHIALATPTDHVHRKLRLGGDRQRIQTLSAAAALDLLRRHLTLSAG